MSKREKKILDGCAVDTFCDGPCRNNHRRKYNPATKETSQCPAHYRYYMEETRPESSGGGRGRKSKKRVQWKRIELQ